jgi:preprotein translocase subunit YajC
VSHLAALAFTFAASTSAKNKSSSGNYFFLIILIGFGAVWYFVLRPQQQKARKAREQGSQFEVGDEVVTVGGIVGTVLDIEGDRVTLVSGGGGDTPPTQIVLVRQAINRKIEPVVAAEADAHDENELDAHEHEDTSADGDSSTDDEDNDGHGAGGRR